MLTRRKSSTYIHTGIYFISRVIFIIVNQPQYYVNAESTSNILLNK